jgi:hypothetical protein
MDVKIDTKIEKLIEKLCDEINHNGYDAGKVKSIAMLTEALVSLRH